MLFRFRSRTSTRRMLYVICPCVNEDSDVETRVSFLCYWSSFKIHTQTQSLHVFHSHVVRLFEKKKKSSLKEKKNTHKKKLNEKNCRRNNVDIYNTYAQWSYVTYSCMHPI